MKNTCTVQIEVITQYHVLILTKTTITERLSFFNIFLTSELGRLAQSSRREFCFIRFRVDAHLYLFALWTDFPDRVFFIATDETCWTANSVATKAFVRFDELRIDGAEILRMRRSAVAPLTIVVTFVTAIIRTDGKMIRAGFVTFPV